MFAEGGWMTFRIEIGMKEGKALQELAEMFEMSGKFFIFYFSILI